MPPIAAPDSYVFRPGRPIYAGLTDPGAGGGAGTLVTTLTFVNDSATEQPAGVVSRSFGLPIKQGEMPAGEYPVFEQGGVLCPATLCGVTTWPDGSMKFCAGMIRFAAAVAGSGSASVVVKSGGVAPATSNRALSDLSTSDLAVELTGITALSGVWTATLADAIATGGDAVLIGDGQAGQVWRIGGEFKQGGSPHGQLYCWHYVEILQDASGAFAGCRYLPRAMQAWTDVASPAGALRQASMVVKSGAATILMMQGADAAGALSTTVTIPHYGSAFGAGQDAARIFIQGGGTQAVNATTRCTYTKANFIASRVVPPYDITKNPTVNSVRLYNPGATAGMTAFTSTTGEREEIAVLNSMAARHVLDQSKLNHDSCLAMAMVQCTWRTGLRQKSTKQIIPATGAASYTGLGTTQSTWRYWPGYTVGLQTDVPAGHVWDGEYEPSHRPQNCYYAYLISGEQQYLDMLVEQAAEVMLTTEPGSLQTWTTTTPVVGNPYQNYWHSRDPQIAGQVYKGAGLHFRADLLRLAAWSERDVYEAAYIYPDVCPAGTQTRAYLRDVSEGIWAGINAYNNALPQSWRDSGLSGLQYGVIRDGGGTVIIEEAEESPWTVGYYGNVIAHGASLSGHAGALAVAQHFSNFWTAIAAAGDIANATAYRATTYDETDTRMESINDITVNLYHGIVSSNAATGVFTISGTNSPDNITNGDRFIFFDGGNPMSQPKRTMFHAVQASGKTFKLALTPGGAPVSVVSTIAECSFRCFLQDATPIRSFNDEVADFGYLANIRSAIHHMRAIGITSIQPAVDEVAIKFNGSGMSLTVDPKNALAPAYPGV